MMNCYYELLERIENSSLKEEIKTVLEKIKKDKKLIQKIEEYHKTKDSSIRKEVYQNKNYQRYKHLENRLNLIILESNKILGELRNEDN